MPGADLAQLLIRATKCITAELGERLRPEPHLRLRYSCSPYHQNSALFRFIGELGRAARFGSGDEPAAS